MLVVLGIPLEIVLSTLLQLLNSSHIKTFWGFGCILAIVCNMFTKMNLSNHPSKRDRYAFRWGCLVSMQDGLGVTAVESLLSN